MNEKEKEKLEQVKRLSEDGMYARVTDVRVKNGSSNLLGSRSYLKSVTFYSKLPSEELVKHTVYIDGFIDQDSELMELLNSFDLDVSSIEDITQYKVPVMKTDGKWKWDTEGIEEGFYKEKTNYERGMDD